MRRSSLHPHFQPGALPSPASPPRLCQGPGGGCSPVEPRCQEDPKTSSRRVLAERDWAGLGLVGLCHPPDHTEKPRMNVHIEHSQLTTVTCPGEEGWSQDHPAVLNLDDFVPQGTGAMPGDIYVGGWGVLLASTWWRPGMWLNTL